jgi:heme/copper-type cytochrome/quinol oxidase subunit 3
VFAVGLKNHKKGNARQARLALFAGSLLILGFLITNAFEWSYLITNGMDIMTVFGGIYYTLMGTFLIHVVIGSIFLFWIISRTMRTGNSGKSVNSVTHVAYFFYVLTLLWLSIYGLVYS